MKILFISESFGCGRYGVAQVIVHITKNCSALSIENRVLSYSRASSDLDNLISRQIPVYGVGKNKTTLGRMLRFHHRMYPYIKGEMSIFKPDVVHIHGAMTFIQSLGVIAAKKSNIPILISPHGMLEPWLWRQKGVIHLCLKKLFWNFLLKPVIKRVDYVHVITGQESETLKKEFPRIPQIKISNAVDINEYSDKQICPNDDKYLLFLGRLHPVKGIDLLIKSFKKVDIDSLRLVIAGPDFDVEYSNKLKYLVQNLGLSEKISFIGSVHGDEKSKLIELAWCTVVPSYSEVIAMVNLESAASYTPTITTHATGLNEWEEGGGLLVEPNVEQLTEAITSVCNWTLDERMKNGKLAREFVEQRYSWDVIGEQWIEAYKMIAQSGTKHD